MLTYLGYQSLFPHGIDVLRKTDFYAISGRRNAFLIAAPQVAELVCVTPATIPHPLIEKRHPEYRLYLIDHLLNITLRHWDIDIRQLGSQAIHEICQLDLLEIGPIVAARVV